MMEYRQINICGKKCEAVKERERSERIAIMEKKLQYCSK